MPLGTEVGLGPGHIVLDRNPRPKKRTAAPTFRPSIGPKSLYFTTPLVFNSPAEGFPWDDLREIFSGCQWAAKIPNAVEILPKI